MLCSVSDVQPRKLHYSLHGFLSLSTVCVRNYTFTYFPLIMFTFRSKTPEVLSANRTEPGSFPLSFAQFPNPSKLEGIDARQAASKWVTEFNKLSSSFNEDSLDRLFLKESYWRDQLCLSWDLRTLHGAQEINNLVNEARGFRIKSLALDTSSQTRAPSVTTLAAANEVDVIRAFLKIETEVGSGTGLVRLVQDDGKWKAFILFTSLQELREYPEKTGGQRPHGVFDNARAEGKNWHERRLENDALGRDDDIPVLIIGSSVYSKFGPVADSHRCWSSWLDSCGAFENVWRKGAGD